ncbi:MAG: O-sialoglycoprotein endopeptidase [Clostridia bacterium]|nr:O-sialoglycoprotein endopeptidase [Clostridia bacterium]
MNIVLGIDTSCYTTSVAAVDLDHNLIGEYRRLLKVPEGERGLQQSRAVFQHVQNLADVFTQVEPLLKGKRIVAVAASTRPRPVPGSYMPVFTVSENLGKALAATLGVPFWATSHQEGHLLAGLWSGGLSWPSAFLAVHLSGGTSELLRVLSHPDQARLEILLLGGTRDLHAGQFIDRVGVAMGLPFPAGPYLEELARNAVGEEVYIPSRVAGYHFHFSGSEACAQRLIQQGVAKEKIARAVENCIAKTIERVLRLAIEETGIKDVLLVGGVAANNYLRERLRFRLGHPAVGAKLIFAQPSLSTDNAVGVALSGAMAFKQGLTV